MGKWPACVSSVIQRSSVNASMPALPPKRPYPEAFDAKRHLSLVMHGRPVYVTDGGFEPAVRFSSPAARSRGDYRRRQAVLAVIREPHGMRPPSRTRVIDTCGTKRLLAEQRPSPGVTSSTTMPCMERCAGGGRHRPAALRLASRRRRRPAAGRALPCPGQPPSRVTRLALIGGCADGKGGKSATRFHQLRGEGVGDTAFDDHALR